MVAMLTAGLLLLARIFKLGFLADFLSRTVLTGFLTGVGIQVGAAMFGDMLGIAATSRRTLVQAADIVKGLHGTNLKALGLSALVVGSILLGRRLAPRFPVALISVVATIILSARFHFSAHGLEVIGSVPGGLPALEFPQVSWDETLALLPVAASCFVMIIAQSSATSRVFAIRDHERVDANTDIMGLAAANAAAAVSGAFVVNGSPTQTAMAESAGARSQVAQLAFAGIVALVLLYLTGPLQYLPRCVLASIVFTIAAGMVDVKTLRAIRNESPGEFLLAIFTAASVVVIGVEQGILMAIVLSLLRHVRNSYHPHTNLLTRLATGEWLPRPATPGSETAPGLIVYRFGSDLFYANDNRFGDEVRALIDHAPAPVRWFVIDASAITNLDYSAAQSLRDLLEDLKRKAVQPIFARVSEYLRSDMDRHGVTALLGEQNIFSTLHRAMAAAHEGPPDPKADPPE
jgi:MFS superfamily sulfate permease-like transporter